MQWIKFSSSVVGVDRAMLILKARRENYRPKKNSLLKSEANPRLYLRKGKEMERNHNSGVRDRLHYPPLKADFNLLAVYEYL